jgi:hypothetical protein
LRRRRLRTTDYADPRSSGACRISPLRICSARPRDARPWCYRDPHITPTADASSVFLTTRLWSAGQALRPGRNRPSGGHSGIFELVDPLPCDAGRCRQIVDVHTALPSQCLNSQKQRRRLPRPRPSTRVSIAWAWHDEFHPVEATLVFQGFPLWRPRRGKQRLKVAGVGSNHSQADQPAQPA